MICGKELLNVFDKLDGVGTNEKILFYTQLRQQDPVASKILEYAANPYRNFWMTSIPKVNSDYEHCNWNQLFQALDQLSSSTGASDNDRWVVAFIASKCEYCRAIVIRVLKQKLRIGMGAKNLNKCGFNIPIASVQLCESDLDKFTSKREFVYSPKLNGIRVLFRKENGVLSFLSRKGHVFPKLPEVFYDLDIPEDFEFDGEFMSVDGKDDALSIASTKKEFKQSIEEIRKRVSIHVFDIPTIEEPLIKRIRELNVLTITRHLRLVPHMWTETKDDDEFSRTMMDAMNDMVAFGYEGIVIKNPYLMYYPDRSNDWVKAKVFQIIDLPVIDVIEGTEGSTAGVLSAFICDYNGVEVKVGSGLSFEQRQEYLHNPPKIIEVKYQSVTKDNSLEFPIFISDRSSELKVE